MPSEFPENEIPVRNLKNIWQHQPTEAFKMSADQLRRKAEQRRNSARFEAIESIAAGLLVFGFFVFAFSRVHVAIPRTGYAVISLWGIYYAYLGYKSFWRKQAAPDATLDITLQSYRRELEHQRDYARHIWRRAGLAFCLLGAMLVILPQVIQSIHAPRVIEPLLPLFALFVVWLTVFFFVRNRRRQRLQQEIAQLRQFESENRS
jgi:hypothetical protein